MLLYAACVLPHFDGDARGLLHRANDQLEAFVGFRADTLELRFEGGQRRLSSHAHQMRENVEIELGLDVRCPRRGEVVHKGERVGTERL